MEKVTLPDMTNGEWRVEKFTVDRVDWHSELRGRSIPQGQSYTRLMRGRDLVMSDTPAEIRDHSYAVASAKDSCLLNGLGIGLVLKNKNILFKDTVTERGI